MIGNDIVDLTLAKTQSNWQRSGFLEKQFTDFEIQEIYKSTNPFLCVWLFWSLKEAVYKCYTQKYPKRFFAPHQIECLFVKDNFGLVKCKEDTFYTQSFVSNAYIHTLASNATHNLKNSTKRIVNICDKAVLNSEIFAKLQEKTGILSSAIQEKKTSVGAPLYYQNSKLLTSSCSKSHHGAFGAYAFILST